jgi:hypothetical protein
LERGFAEWNETWEAAALDRCVRRAERLLSRLKRLQAAIPAIKGLDASIKAEEENISVLRRQKDARSGD